jgi:YegS/Rv2252/BmrU family lipid kinase
MSTGSAVQAKRVFVVLNPVAGTSVVDDVRRALEQHFLPGETTYEVYETLKEDAVERIAREAQGRGYEMVVAAGGDGTVSAVAEGLVGTETPLGIIPLGTANVLARELGISVELEGAVQLLAGEHGVTSIDAMKVGEKHYFTQVGVGIDALMIRDTKREDKRRFGRIAYIWTAMTRLLGFQPRRFLIRADGRQERRRASQIVIANSGVLGQPPFRWGPDIEPDDGRLDVCIVRAQTLLDYLALAWHVVRGQHRRSSNVRYLNARREIVIETRRPLPVQADGEIIGETPVQVQLVPAAVRVIVPETRGDRPSAA